MIAEGRQLGEQWRIYAFDHNGNPALARFGALEGEMVFPGSFERSSGLFYGRSTHDVVTSEGVQTEIEMIDGFGPPNMDTVRLELKDGSVLRAQAIDAPRFETVTFFVLMNPGLAVDDFASIKALNSDGESLAPDDVRG